MRRRAATPDPARTAAGRGALLAGALLLASCAVDRSVDPKLVFTGCTANADCPGSQTCQATRGFTYCTATSAAFTVEGPTLSPALARIGPKSLLRASYTATAPVTGTAYLVGSGGVLVAWKAEPGLRFLLEGKQVEPLKDGDYTLFSVFKDDRGTVVTGTPLDVVVDHTAPLPRVPRFELTPEPGSLADQFLLRPTAAGPRTRVTALNVGPDDDDTRAVLTLLGPDGGAVLVFPSDGGPLALTPPDDPSLPQGLLTARLTLTDAVGNSRTDDHPGVVLDTRPPALDQTESTLVLAPWGTLADAAPVSRVDVSQLPEPGELFVFQGPFSVGHRPVSADGGVGLSLLQTTPPFHLKLVDPAGNESGLQRVGRVRLTFTPRDIDPTDDDRVLEVRANQVAARLIPNPSLATQPTDGGALVLASTGAWRARPSAPGARTNAAVAFDSDREVAIAFGGTQLGNPTRTNDTLEWQGQGWFPRATPVAPAPATRDEVAMAYDSLREVVLLFAGLTGETWSWDGAQWKRLAVFEGPGKTPSPRTRFAMAFDKRAGHLVLFGGDDGVSELNDTWVWNGLAWSKASPATPPSARGGHAMAYHPPSGGIVMFGDDQRNLGDVHWWDGVAQSWARQPAEPGPLVTPAMVFDDHAQQLTAVDLSNGRAVALVGTSDGGGLSGFLWDAGEPVVAPAPLGAMAFFDSARRTFVLANAGRRWQQKPELQGQWNTFEADRPPGRLRHAALAYSPLGDTYVLFGGQTSATAPPVGQTFCFGAEGWQPAIVDGGPPARWGHTLTAVPNAVPPVLVLHGGFDATGLPLADTWQLRIAGRGCAVEWTQLPSSATPRAGHSAAFDGARLVVWDADGGAQFRADGGWSALGVAPTPGPAGVWAGAAFDVRTDRLVVAGGGPTHAQTCGLGADCRSTSFALDAGGWAPLGPLPAPRKGNALWYDSYAGAIFSFGGHTSPGMPGQPPAASLSRLSGGWADQSVADLESDFEPAERAYHAMAYRPRAASALLFGGSTPGGAVFDDTWDFKVARQRPAVVFHIDLNRFVFKPFGRVAFTALEAEAIAGGDGVTASAAGAPVPKAGAEVQGYLDGRWQAPFDAVPGGSNAAPPSAPGRCSLTTTQRLDALLVGNRRLSVAVTPLGESGAASAQLKVERVSVTVGFELPPP